MVGVKARADREVKTNFEEGFSTDYLDAIEAESFRALRLFQAVSRLQSRWIVSPWAPEFFGALLTELADLVESDVSLLCVAAGPPGVAPAFEPLAYRDAGRVEVVQGAGPLRVPPNLIELALGLGMAAAVPEPGAVPARASDVARRFLALDARRLVLPLWEGGVIRGVIGLGRQAGRFSESDAALLDPLAAAVAVMLSTERGGVGGGGGVGAGGVELDETGSREGRGDSEETLGQLAEAFDGVLWLSTPDKERFLYVSPAYERIWEQPLEELFRNPAAWLERVVPEDRERVRQASLERQVLGQYDEEYRIELADGRQRWIHDRAFPIRGADGSIHRIAGVAEDVTRQKELESRVLHSQKMESIGRLARGVSHEFNNMLTAIGSFARLALESLPEDHAARSDIEQVITAADRAAVVTRQLLAFARQQPLKPVRVEPATVLRNVRPLLARLVRENIEVVLRMEPAPGRIRVDPAVVEQVLINLVVHACDAMPQGGRLTIQSGMTAVLRDAAGGRASGPSRQYGFYSVSDTGVGLSPEEVQHIFEPFYAIGGASRDSGLGLAMVHGVVFQSGGFVDIQTAVGKGTTIQIFFPQAEEPDEDTPTIDAPSLNGTETILVAEDEPEVRKLVTKILRAKGYTVLEAIDGEDALRLAGILERARIHLLITDMVMPRLGGKELAAKMRQQRPDIRVLFMSGYTTESLPQLELAMTGASYLYKPFAPQVFLRTVRQVLDATPPT